MADSLLPPNATDLERALEAATARVGDVPVPVGALWDPDICPPAVLPWLAWALSVDTCDAGWTDAQKREAIRRSYRVHAYKGTRTAVEAALGAVDYDVDLVEWWQDAPAADPYTFRAEVEITGRGVDDATQSQIVALINGAKNVRSHMSTLTLVGAIRGGLYAGAWTTAGETVEVLPHQLTLVEATGAYAVGAGGAAYDTVSVYPEGP